MSDARKRLEAQLTDIVSRLVKLIEPWCVLCGAPTTDPSHFIKRGKNGTQWDLTNVHGMCRPCHVAWDGHKSVAYREWMIARYRQAVVDELEGERFTPTRLTLEQLRDTKQLLASTLKRMEGA